MESTCLGMETAGEETFPRKEVTAMAGLGTVQNLHIEGHKGSYCTRAGIADKRRAVRILLS